MKLGDLVRVTRHGLFQLEYASRSIGLIVEIPKRVPVQIVYVLWFDRKKPSPMNTVWLEVIE